MPSPKIAEDLRDYLVNTTGLSNVTVGFLNPTPINQYAVIEYAGPANVKTHGGGTAVLDESTVQFLARHAKAETARDNIHTVIDALDGLKDVTVNSTVYLYIQEISRPRILVREESGAVTYAWEALVQARR